MTAVAQLALESLLRYTDAPRRLRPGNRITLLHGGHETYPAMLAAIADARESICLETYILESDEIGEQFAAALGERAQGGVAVRVIYDSVGALGVSRRFLNDLAATGVELLEYHPIAPWKERFSLWRRDHRKILVVDDRVGFTGGINIGREYTSLGSGGAGWHDVHCQIEGPVVGDLARLFHQVWIREGGAPYAPGPAPYPLVGDDTCLARVIHNRERRRRAKIRRAYIHAFNRARRTIFLMNAYFVPDRGIRRALCRASHRGVKVQVIVPEHYDIPVIEYATEHLHGVLLRHGVEILYWPETMMHAKTAVIDETWSTVGTYNLDAQSLRFNLEVVLEVLDARFGERMAARFAADADRCRPLTLTVWRDRGLGRKILGWLLYRFRRWL